MRAFSLTRSACWFCLAVPLVLAHLQRSASFPNVNVPLARIEDNVCFEQKKPECHDSIELAAAERHIQAYLQSNRSKGKFHVQGWRWHTLSLVREAGRLRELALRLKPSADEMTTLNEAVTYVINFNMKGLHKIERDLFFPWVRQRMQSVGETELVQACHQVLDQLELEQNTMEWLGTSITDVVKVASHPSASTTLRSQAIKTVAANSAEIAKRASSMKELEDCLLVPTISMLVSESDQKSLNNQVIRRLGILDSRLHLVGMHEAVQDLGNDEERRLFEEVIPTIPRLMIPRWKRLLYQPKAGALDTA